MTKMVRDPRNPDPAYMCRTDSCVKFHDDLRKTVDLLKLAGSEPPLYFVVEGLSVWPQSLEEMKSSREYYYEEHSCPTNFIRVALISTGGDHDPHGLFEFVDGVWMMDEYVDDEEYLEQVFPQLKG